MFHKLFITAVAVLGVWGCTAHAPVVATSDTREQAQPGSLPAGEGWWYARFHINRPAGEEISWYMGTLIGGEVIAPIFDEYYQDVYIWRIHRRAGNDSYGHVFSFIFYSTPQGAQRIFNAIEDNAVVKSELASGRLTRVTVDDVSKISRPNIEDTSDASWPLSVQKTWPAMIMGASRMWLDLVSDLAARESASGGLEVKYKKVQDNMTRIWSEQGQHAILHHLNAIYAYQPLLIRY